MRSAARSSPAAATGAAREPRPDLDARVVERFGLDLSKCPPYAVESLRAALAGAGAGAALDDEVVRCCVGETMFLRHPEHFEALRRLAPELPGAIAGGPIRAWSAGCSTGEEAYSLAAVLSGAAAVGVEILGTDLVPEALDRARRGVYGPWSLRGVDAGAAAGWLSIEGAEVRVREDVRAKVSFARENLAERAPAEGLDVVFCRNVLLYFREEAAEAALRRIAASLRPGGVLFLGPFDPTPPSGEAWREEGAGAARWYRRIDGASRSRPPSAAPPASGVQRAPSPGDDPPIAADGSADREVEEALARARALSGEGRRDEALGVLEAIAQRAPLTIEIHVLAALIADEAGLAEAALAAARRAVFLAPDEVVPRYLLGVCMDRVGDCDRAIRLLEGALSTLSRDGDPGRPLRYGEGMTGSQIRRSIDVRLGERR